MENLIQSLETDLFSKAPSSQISDWIHCYFFTGLDGVKKTWGMSGTAMNRILPAQYEDGEWDSEFNAQKSLSPHESNKTL